MAKNRNKGRNRGNKTQLGQIGMPTGTNIIGAGKGGGGYGTVQQNAKVAKGSPIVNPFVIPKYSGQNVGSWVYPSMYTRPWDTTLVRQACDQAIKMGYTQDYATLTSWIYEKSPFVQSLFFKLGLALDKVKFYVNDKTGNEIPELTLEMCSKPWQMQLRKEILFGYFWGFSGINFDPLFGKCYKYPMQQIDPINRMLKANTFSFYDGEAFDDNDNLLFIQPSNNYEAFLGWMQPIAFSYVEMNVNNNNWIAAGRRLAFPLMTVGYPQDDGSKDENGLPTNNYKNDAVAIASDIDPTNGLVYPYTLDNDGNIQKSIEIDFEQTGTSANAHKIYQEFNNDMKAEIQELVFGRSLTQATGKGGNRALGEVEEAAVDERVAGLVPFVLAVLNDDYKTKLSKFYKNLPNGWQFGYSTPKKLTHEQMKTLSEVTNANGYTLTERFFTENGVPLDFIEKKQVIKPVANKSDSENLSFQMSKKKLWSL